MPEPIHGYWRCSRCQGGGEDAPGIPCRACNGTGMKRLRLDILPRCRHGNCLVDGGGERLVPPCGCRMCHYCHNLADERIGERNSCPNHYADALEAASRDNAKVTWKDRAPGRRDK